MSTVYAKQYGRLGNNLFQKAAAIGYATKHDMKYDLCAWYASGWADCKTGKQRMLIQERGHNYQELPAPKRDYVVLDGYWQSSKYFDHCREEVINALGYKWSPIDFNEDVCAIHVRRGDYLKYPDKHPVVTDEYLKKAMSRMFGKTCTKTFMFFSDDIEWCKDFVKRHYFSAYNILFSERMDEEYDLHCMSSCQHQIISNSTFSWWGAWLNQNPDKVVISPSKDNWFGPGNAHLDTSDLIPDLWIQIKY